MLVSRAAICVCFVLSLLTSCDDRRTLNIRLAENMPLDLVTWPRDPNNSVVLLGKRTVALQPDAPEYHQFDQWLTTSQQGWRKLPFEKGPSDGIFVISGDLHFHFHLRTVTLTMGGTTYFKEISEDEYAFLKPRAGI